MIGINTALRSGVALAAMIGSATAAQAQSTLPPADVTQAPAAASSTQPTPQGDIVITGSRIRRNPLNLDAPRVFLDQQDIAKTGLSSINDVLQRLPSSGGGLNGKFNNSGNLGNPPDGGGVGAGSAEIDLRYLGSRRTLVLVDGLRFVPGASASGVPASVDLNTIPEGMIERVEVLQDGASAVYGSDAIAGVVNIITKQHQKGFVLSAQYGQFGQGDGKSQDYEASWGNGDGHRLNLVIGGNYVKQGAVSSGDRALSRFPAPYATSCAAGGCSGTPIMGRFDVLRDPSLPADPGCEDPDACNPIIIGTNPFLDLSLNSPVLVGAPNYDPLNPTGPGSDFHNFGTPDRFNFAPYNYFQIPLERYGLFANLKYELADNFNFSVKAMWNERKSKNQAAPLPFGIGAACGCTPVLDSIGVDVSNPFNPFGVTLDSTNMQFIARRFVEGGPRRFSQKVDTNYLVATFDGSFVVGGRDWYWDLNGVYGHNRAKQRMLGNINADHLRQALGPVDDCTGLPGNDGVGTCTPFNIFGGAGSITPEMIDFVTFTQRDRSKQDLYDATANISGELFDLPGGPLGLAAGAEYRELSGSFDPDPVVQAGFSSDIPAAHTGGGIHSSEVYAEVNAPVLKDIPAIALLELSGAVRYSKYKTSPESGHASTSFSHTTLKGSANWKPINDLRFRASYAQGFRAPSIGEFFGSLSRFDQTIADPCSADNTSPDSYTNSATVKANCIAHGVPGNGSYNQTNPQISVAVGGNENLKPETSKSWVFGGVYSPSFLPGLSIEANHYNVRITGAIQPVDAAFTLNNCEVNNDPSACALVTRVGGTLTGVAGILGNIAGIKTKGIDVNLAYRGRKTSIGRFGVTWNNTFLRNFDVIVPVTGGTTVISREGTEQGSPSQGFPKWKSVGVLDWDLADVGASLTGRYISKLRETAASGGGNVMSAKFYTDLQLRWNPAWGRHQFGFAVGGNNILNTRAPGCVSCDLNNFDPSMYDVPGRFFYVRAGVKL
ncbi:MAG TPA: TonB-dependent receptor [Sphingomicrobium sp.]|nr:TonB-dependent receptor [Sphingomicrobium sp.]